MYMHKRPTVCYCMTLDEVSEREHQHQHERKMLKGRTI